jgi:hypothetical protein
MPNNQRDPNAANSGTGSAISRTFAYTIIAAVLLLAVMRHLFGSIRVEAGVK